MYFNQLSKDYKKINKLKKNNNYNDFSLQELQKLPILSGIVELSFEKHLFCMINILNDDAVPLKYLWRNSYEKLSMKLWFEITRKNGFFFDIGAHTGIYSIISNLNKKVNNTISIEPFFINYSRLLSNLKLNNIDPKNCFLAAASDSEGMAKIKVNTPLTYHGSAGSLSDSGNFSINKIKIDSFKLEKKIKGIKIDTEGHEFEVIEGGKNLITEDKPEIIFEINKNSFNKIFSFLSSLNYKFYFIDEINQNLIEINEFNDNLIKPEGSNCIAKPVK